MALILIPVIAAVGFMVGSSFGQSTSASIATLIFATLAIGVFASIFKMARRWDATP